MISDYLRNEDGVPRILTREQALAMGFTRHAIEHRLRTGRWHRILPHTYLTGSTLTWPDRVDAALAFAGPESLLTGSAALADLGLRSVQRPRKMLVLVRPQNRTRPAGWVRLRRTHRWPERSLLPGPRRADAARAVADLALERRDLDSVRALVAQATRAGLCSAEELGVELEAGPRAGSANFRRALLEIDAGAWSAPEAHAADLLRRCPRIPPFEPNKTVRLPDGTHLTVDFLWPKLRAVLEIDSDEYHWDDEDDHDSTLERHYTLTKGHLAVMSRRPRAIRMAPKKFQRDVESFLAARAAELGLPLA